VLALLRHVGHGCAVDVVAQKTRQFHEPFYARDGAADMVEEGMPDFAGLFGYVGRFTLLDFCSQRLG
jgi:hypothetical protein